MSLSDDGYRQVYPDLLKEGWSGALSKLGSKVTWLKREFADGFSGVQKIFSHDTVRWEELSRVFLRTDYFDLDLKFRLYLQKNIQSSSRAIVARFFAEKGRFLAGHFSTHYHPSEPGKPLKGKEAIAWEKQFVTVRNEKVEQMTFDILETLNYTGFGALWFVVDNEGTPYMTQMVPRIERKMCIQGALSERLDLWGTDPCYFFNEIYARNKANGSFDFSNSTPAIMDAGVRFIDIVRQIQRKSLINASDKKYWIVQPKDEKYKKWLNLQVNEK